MTRDFVVSVYRCLLDHGADVAAVNNEGELPLDLAEEEDMEDALTDEIERLGKLSILAVLLENKISCKHVDAEKPTHWCIFAKNCICVGILYQQTQTY